MDRPSVYKPGNNKVVIDADHYGEDPVREWICPYDNTIMYARKSKGEAWCPRCQDYIDIGAGKAQETQTIVDPNKSRAVDTETYAATTPGTEYFTDQIRIKKEPELKSGFKALRDKGLHITNYREDVG